MTPASSRLLVLLVAATLTMVAPNPAHAKKVADAPIHQALKRMLRSPALKTVDVSVSVRKASGEVVLTHRGDAVSNPASGTKLLTTAAALHFLGAKRRFITRVLLTLDEQGRAVGPVAVVGDGDPKLMPEHIKAIAQKLVKEHGLREVSEIVVDGRVFGGDGVPPAYDQKPTAAGYRASVGGAGSHFGAVWLGLKPGKVGAPAKASVSPAVGAVELVNRVTTVKMAKGKKSTIATSVHRMKDGRTRMVVSGELSASTKRWKERRRLTDPNVLTGYLLRYALRRQKVAGAREAKVRLLGAKDPKPTGTIVVEHKSLSVLGLLKDVNVWSNNYMAESLFAQLSRATNPIASTDWRTSQMNTGAVLKTLGLADGSYRVVNGSGLYRATYISAAAMTRLLVAMRKHKRLGAPFLSSLAVSGTSGTLKGRLGGPMKGRFVGKTGTLDEVVSLSGYLTTKRGTVLAVSLMVNKGTPKRTAAYRAAFDRFVRELFKRL